MSAIDVMMNPDLKKLREENIQRLKNLPEPEQTRTLWFIFGWVNADDPVDVAEAMKARTG